MVRKLLLLACAGALGTLARYGLAGWVQKVTRAYLPWGTLAANVAGCFLAGLLWTLFENRWPVSGETRAIVLIGFMGAFTTFSALILETGELMRATEWGYAGLNLLLHVALGFVALYLGINLGRLTG